MITNPSRIWEQIRKGRTQSTLVDSVVKNHQNGVLQKKKVQRQKDFVNGKRRAIRTSIVITKDKQEGPYVEIFPHKFFSFC